MGSLKNILVDSSSSIGQDMSSSFDSFETDVINISPDNRLGVVTLQFNCTDAVGAKVKLMQSLDAVKFDYVRDSSENDIEISLSGACTIANVVNIYATYLKVVGTTGGTGTIDEIKILAL